MQVLTEHNDILNFLGQVPILSCTIRVTDKCNLKCVQCYSNANQKSEKNIISYEEIISLLKELKNNNVIRLSITGGEPFLRADMLDILEAASNMGFEIYISTNGTIDSIDFSRLANVNLKVLQISLDGLGNVHDEIRGQKGSYEKAMSFIAKSKMVNTKIQVGVAFTLMKQNMENMISLYNVLKETAIDIFSIIPVQRIGRSVAEYSLSPFQIKDQLECIARYYCQDSNKTFQLNLMVSPALVPKCLSGVSDYFQGYLCTYPYSLAVSAEGKYSLCDGMLDDPKSIIGNIQDNLKKVFECSFVNRILNICSNELVGICGKCSFNSFCAGGCRADAYWATGSNYKSDLMCQSYYDCGIFPDEYILQSND